MSRVAISYIDVVEAPGPGHIDQSEAARLLGCTRATVANRLSARNLPLVRWTLRPGTARVYMRETDLASLGPGPKVQRRDNETVLPADSDDPTFQSLEVAVVQARDKRARRAAALRFLAYWWRGYAEDGLLRLDTGLSDAENDILEKECLDTFDWMDRVAKKIEAGR